MPSSQKAKLLVSFMPLIVWPWQNRSYIVEASCDTLIAKLGAAIAEDTRWRGRIGSTEFVVHKLYGFRLSSKTRRLVLPNKYVFVGRWRSCGNRCLLYLRYRPTKWALPELAALAVFVLAHLIIIVGAGASGHWMAALGAMAQGTIAFVFLNGFISWYESEELNELFWLMGAKLCNVPERK